MLQFRPNHIRPEDSGTTYGDIYSRYVTCPLFVISPISRFIYSLIDITQFSTYFSDDQIQINCIVSSLPKEIPEADMCKRSLALRAY